MRKLILFLVTISMLLAVGCAGSSSDPKPKLHEPLYDRHTKISYVRSVQRNDDSVAVFETKPDTDISLRIYQADNSDRVTMGRVENMSGQVSAYTWNKPSSGVLRYYDSQTETWIEDEISPQILCLSMVELSFEDGSSYLIYPPKTYRPLRNGVVEYLPECDGFLQIEETKKGWVFSLQALLPSDDFISDFTVVQGLRPMLDWDYPDCAALWKNYTLESEPKWRFDGYYYPCPYNYVPTGVNYLYNSPAAYLVKSMIYAASVHPASENLAFAMLDTIALEQNESGYWPTSPRSEWLYEDYGVDRGFYDTRFNSDLVKLYRMYYDSYGGDFFLNIMEKYADFFLEFAEREHFLSPNGGWFIPDYDPAKTKPHSSLNHQLAEIIELYELSSLLNRADLEELADKMLFAITDTKKNWIAETGDLHYCVYPDGTYGAQDYPYLTYNDLFDMQQLLLERQGETDDALQYLMNRKKRWMDRQGVKGYKQ